MIETLLTGALRAHGAGTALVGHMGEGSAAAVEGVAKEAGVRALDLGPGRPAAAGGADRAVDLAVLVAATTADLRAAVPLSGGLPSASGVAIAVLEAAPRPSPPLPSPPGLGQWTGLLSSRTRRLPDRGWWWEFSFTDPVETGEVLAAVARGLVGGRRSPAPPPLPSASDRSADDLSWRRLGAPGTVNRTAGYPRPSVGDVPAVDERVVNPMGFTRVSKAAVGQLVSCDGRWVLLVGGKVRWRVPEDGAVSDAVVAGLRDLRAVRVEWGRHSGPVAAVRTVANLAAAGVPLVGARPPVWARPLGEELHDLLAWSREEELADELLREEHSVRLRRAALRLHGRYARWYGSGPGAPPEPSVSVVLCTRRPEMVGFALRQVVRQRGVDVQAVLALHGFGTDAPGVAEAVAAYRARGRELVVWEPDPAMVLGSVLNGAIARASGTLVAKMDDDDWYGPDHLSDLVLARRYSGADLVGSATEYYHLEQLDLTLRRTIHSERFVRHVTGAGMLTDRTVLEEVGGFRPMGLGEDNALLDDLRDAGGSIYRTHGLGCVIRRRRSGHTWHEDSGYFLRGTQRQWHGWRPSALLESDSADVPGPVPGTNTSDTTTFGSRR
ncbi:glycosyltransferase [Nocardiopsis ganjiahuensis]|uniref:glycosyltransferase n=1 Tax=Nocardiopsis ganjiahuensis TaxID=239984 RepID=UPI0003468084|nr:glycosyltransferase family 2 protein [Nocardiopsis ganjiahuensis]